MLTPIADKTAERELRTTVRVDGFLALTGDRRINTYRVGMYSGKRHACGFNIQVIGSHRETLVLTGRPMPGSMHDAKVWRESGLAARFDGQQRFYDWAWIGTHHDTPGCHGLLIRRNRAGELAFYLCWTAHPVPLSTLIRVAGTPWAVEENFQIAKGQVGLDQYQCRGWTQWHRYTVLAMLALAILAITIATMHKPSRVRISYPATVELIELTMPEIRRLINAILARPTRPDTVLAWSAWRRRHQAPARASHYKRREAMENGQLSR